MQGKKIANILLALFIFTNAQNQTIRIGLFNETNTRSVVVTIVKGSYLIIADGRAVLSAAKNDVFFINMQADSLNCHSIDEELGYFKKVNFQSTTDTSSFALRLVNPADGPRVYDDNLEVEIKLGKVQTINVVDMDKYIAGVVEAEGGSRAGLEYYKVQALLCRTYAYNNLERHIEEGFNLCDGVHCQAYKGSCNPNSPIYKASYETHNKVVIDSDSTLITSVFHSNCGGETESAERVWLLKKNYLVSVKDPYCRNSRNATWEYTITLNEWKEYLKKNGFKLSQGVSPLLFNTLQITRKQYYKVGDDSISFKKIREDFKLKSTFFSVSVNGSKVILNGRGYGHGVGLCQEGAMQMDLLGYKYNEIINFYFKNVKIISIDSVTVQKNPTLKSIKLNNFNKY